MRTVLLEKGTEFSDLNSVGCQNAREFWNYLNPPNFTLGDADLVVVKKDFIFDTRELLNIKLRIYFNNYGRFYLVGIFATPGQIDKIEVLGSDGHSISITEWESYKDGIRTSYIEPYEVETYPGVL